jgi:hypothetical protein
MSFSFSILEKTDRDEEDRGDKEASYPLYPLHSC